MSHKDTIRYAELDALRAELKYRQEVCRQLRNATIEECAREIESDKWIGRTAFELAAAIRALKERS